MKKYTTHTTQNAITLEHISKKYEIRHEKPTFVEQFVKGRNETFWALRDIHITINKGERIGIIGHNGSGKTTLLKIIANITTPTTGSRRVHGKIVSLIDLRAGFHEDLTGIQNIFLNGMLLGMTKNEVSQQLSSIIKFANIKQFIDAPMFTYSTGMALRLGFAVAVHAKPEILILDESIQTGDKYFFTKMQNTLQKLFESGITVVMSSHSQDIIQTYCSRYIVLKDGKITMDGGHEVLSAYFKTK